MGFISRLRLKLMTLKFNDAFDLVLQLYYSYLLLVNFVFHQVNLDFYFSNLLLTMSYQLVRFVFFFLGVLYMIR